MKNFVLSQRTRNLYLLFIGIGLVAFFGTLFFDPTRVWHAYIMNYYFFAIIGIGGCFFAAIQHLTSAGWSVTVRRIPESFYSLLVPSILLFIPIAFFGKNIYEWTHADAVAEDHLLQMKTAYLNVPFFIVRTALFFAVWYFLGGALVRNSLRQDTEGGIELTNRNKVMSAIFLPPFAIFFSFFSVDLLMSIDPHWFSTIFGVVCFANLFLAVVAIGIITLINLKQGGHFGDSVNENHIGNLGLLLFGFTVFYAYVAFSQFMLIWYGNMPEETSFYLKRWENGWSTVAYAIMIFKFFVPFVLLLPYAAKRNMDHLKKMSYLVLAAIWLDLFWLVMPNFSKVPFLPWLEVCLGLGFTGILGLTISKFLSQHPLQPQKDPRVHEALHLH